MVQAGGRVEDSTVCDLLFKQKEKPKNFLFCKAINVYSDRFRINVYTRTYDELRDLEQTKIAESYFATYDGSTLNIIA